MPRIFAAGGAHIDRRGRVSGRYVPAASNPGVLSEDIGGGAFNALRAARRHGIDSSLLSIRGGDAAGAQVARAIADAGIEDLSAVFLDRTTPSYTALLDETGELIAGLADMGLYELAFAKQVARSKVRLAIEQADAILCDANLPASALKRLAAAAAGRPVYAIGVSPAKIVRLADMLPSLACLFMNRNEAASLCGEAQQPAQMAARLRSKGLARGVITAGAAPVVAFDGEDMFCIAPPAPRAVSDVTGAGDALAGATVAALLMGEPLRQALRRGIAAAILTVESKAAVATFSVKAFGQALGLVPPPHAVD